MIQKVSLAALVLRIPFEDVELGSASLVRVVPGRVRQPRERALMELLVRIRIHAAFVIVGQGGSCQNR